MHNIFDGTFNGMGCSEMYRSYVFPDLFPGHKRARLENWPADEREIWAGVYTPERRAELMQQREESRV